MFSAALVVLVLILLVATGLVIWAWFAISRVEEELREIGGFKARHFEVEPRTRALMKDRDGTPLVETRPFDGHRSHPNIAQRRPRLVDVRQGRRHRE